MLTESSPKPHITSMIRQFSIKTFAAGLLLLCAPLHEAGAGDQSKAIVNGLEARSVNELFEMSRRQPDAAMTSITPTTPNTFRFLFVWPSSNPVMTYERVGQSFVERFASFARELNLLAVGFCLPTHTLLFGTAFFGEREVRIAYRDIEVRYLAGLRRPCPGRYVTIAQIETHLASTAPFARLSRRRLPGAPSEQMTVPEEGLRPFLNPPSAAPQD
jgi:hypothetical protein